MATILIVDDENFVRDLLKRWLQPTGHTIHEADSAETALQVLEQMPVGVVFSDIQMPGHNGLWLTAEIRKRYPTTAVVLATTVSTIPPRFSMQAGVLAYLVKPLSESAVLEGLAAALDWHAKAVVTLPPVMPLDKLLSWLDSLA